MDKRIILRTVPFFQERQIDKLIVFMVMVKMYLKFFEIKRKGYNYGLED